jgi:hypothetical protein
LDLDVRMLLPIPSVVEACRKKDITITGWPFVCELIDAHLLPTVGDFMRVENTLLQISNQVRRKLEIRPRFEVFSGVNLKFSSTTTRQKQAIEKLSCEWHWPEPSNVVRV